MNNSPESASLQFQIFATDRLQVGKWWSYQGHVSPFTRLFLIHDGQQQAFFNGETLIMRPGSVYLVPPFVPVDYSCKNQCEQHYFIFRAGSGGEELAAAYSLPSRRPLRPLDLALGDELLQHFPSFALTNVDANDPRYNDQVWQGRNDSLTPQQRMVADGVLRLLLAPFLVEARPQPQMLRFSRVFEFIEVNLHRPLALADLAAAAELDPTYFSDLFRKHIGIRPMEYLLRRRLDRAQDLLGSSSDLIAQVASRCGFSDGNYFIRVYKKRFGISPAASRQAK